MLCPLHAQDKLCSILNLEGVLFMEFYASVKEEGMFLGVFC